MTYDYGLPRCILDSEDGENTEISGLFIKLENVTTPKTTILIRGLQNDRQNTICFMQVKLKFSLEQAMKAQMGSRGIALLFL